MLTEIELADAQYNARDVLGMCRTWPHLADMLEHAGTVDLYNADEMMADLALQMTRIGMPVNGERRQQVGERLRALRDTAIENLRVFTEGQYRDNFLDWSARFFAAKARKGEPTTGALRIGRTFATAALEEARTALRDWKAYRKSLPADSSEIAEVEENVAVCKANVVICKREFMGSEDDAFHGLIHSAESAFEARMIIRRTEFAAKMEKKGVNFGAKVQQCAILRAAGVPLFQVTAKTGLPKIDKEILKGLERHAAAKFLLQYILTEKTINVYIEGEKRIGKRGSTRPVVVEEDGYLHPLWSTTKITGRWGSSPNVQNVSSRAGGGAENLRDMFEAPEGYVLVGADQKQLEARLIAAMSQCKFLLQVFAEDRDVHSEMAAVGFPQTWPMLAITHEEHKRTVGKCGCPVCNEWKKTRDVTKRLEYGGFYGGKEQTLWESVAGDYPDFTIHQTRVFLREFNARMPEVIAWREAVLQEAVRHKEIRSPILGRRQVFPLGHVDPNVAYNFKAQSGGADLWELGAIKFCERWDQYDIDARLLHNGHDSVLIMCREDLAPEVEKDVCECWNYEWWGVRFEMEAQTASQWSKT